MIATQSYLTTVTLNQVHVTLNQVHVTLNQVCYKSILVEMCLV